MPCRSRLPAIGVALALGLLTWIAPAAPGEPPAVAAPGPHPLAAEFDAAIRPMLAEFCIDCHSTKRMKGDLDLERFTDTAAVGGDLLAWRRVIEMIEDREMPPKKEPQLSADQRDRLVQWARSFIDDAIRARAGDPGRVVLRRLNNAEFDRTIGDLTGVDLRPSRQFPADGAAGEGFTNTGQSLVMSPGLLAKYLDAAKAIADHAVLTPDGIRFSPHTTRRDWTDESIARIRRFYEPFSGDGKLPLTPYLAATLRHRDELAAGKTTIEQIAEREKLNARYLRTLWGALNGNDGGEPLSTIRASWRGAAVGDAEAVARRIATLQAMTWKFNVVGSYMADVWQEPVNPAVERTATLKIKPNPPPEQSEAVYYLAARRLTGAGGVDGAGVVWRAPRFEGGGREPMTLRDVSALARRHAAANRALLADTDRYLAAVVDAVNPRAMSVADAAARYRVDPSVLARWVDLVRIGPAAPSDFAPDPGEPAPIALLLRKVTHNAPVTGWGQSEQSELPVVVSNSSDETRKVPGTALPHRIAVHPLPRQFVAVAWRSPIDGQVRLGAAIAHAHDACGNGIAWWLEHRRGDKAQRLSGGVIDRGGSATLDPRPVNVRKGDLLLVTIGARDGEHTCDLTRVDCIITETPGSDAGGEPRTWDLAADVADDITAGNPHADRLGNADVWRFVMGPDAGASPGSSSAAPAIAADSALGRWRAAAMDPTQAEERAALAVKVRDILVGPRPQPSGDRSVHDLLNGMTSPLLGGASDLAATDATDAESDSRFGLPASRFVAIGDKGDAVDLAAAFDTVVEVRVPASIARDREMLVDAQVAPGASAAMAYVTLTNNPPNLAAPPGKDGRLIGSADLADADAIAAGFDRFRAVFPINLYDPAIVPTDEVISLRLFVREDGHLMRLMLDDDQRRELDRLWGDLRFVSQQHLTELRNFSVFMGFVSQDGPESYKRVDAKLREPVKRRGEAFEAELRATEPVHVYAVLRFAERAYRRPLDESERQALRDLYKKLRAEEVDHEAAIRLVLARVLVSPPFLYRLESPAPGVAPTPVTDHELATRLSYFLWASTPDDALLDAAASGRLTDEAALVEQTRRMLADDRARSLAVEFAGQWLHFRGFDEYNEKSETLFPMFDADLRAAMLEESVLFFDDLFRHDGSVLSILDADHTFLNAKLAAHYGVPGVAGDEFRRVDGVKRYGRGGVLGLATILTQQSGASRTSPVLRGTWLIETLLGQKLPKPPANVPQLPDTDTSTADLSTRQLTERHRADPSCAACHNKIDPFGFALEGFDPIGRRRTMDGKHAIDTKATLPGAGADGVAIDGIDGLREYLATQRREQFLRTFCRKLLGYALGRSVTLSDEPLLELMRKNGEHDGHRFWSYVTTIVRSKQFRCKRGADDTEP